MISRTKLIVLLSMIALVSREISSRNEDASDTIEHIVVHTSVLSESLRYLYEGELHHVRRCGREWTQWLQATPASSAIHTDEPSELKVLTVATR